MRKISGAQSVSLQTIAQKVGAKEFGDTTRSVNGLCPLDQPEPNALSFISSGVTSAKLERLRASEVFAAFVPLHECEQIEEFLPEDFSVLGVADPFLAMINSVPFFYSELLPTAGIHPSAVVDPSATIGKGVCIDAFCVIGADVVIEDGVQLFPHVTVYAGAKIGSQTIIHSGAVIREDCIVGAQSVIQNGAIIGADGFGYRPDPQLGLVAFPQVGIVSLSPRVDIGANACVDRGALGDTTVGVGSKIDNLVQVGHNTRIGSHSILCGQVGVSGSCTIGDQVTLAGGVGVADHVEIVSNTRFGARSGITGSVKEPGDYAGWPVVKASEWRRQAALLRSLPKVIRELKAGLK